MSSDFSKETVRSQEKGERTVFLYFSLHAVTW